MAVTYYDTEQFYEQPSTEKLQENAEQTLKKALGKGKKMKPVIVEGRSIANSWWGRAWCENLERYADYESRLERGKRYLRTGTVVDLQIKKGIVSARVQGRRKSPYKVEIRISPISEDNLQRIMGICEKRIESMDMLLKGKFPEDLRDTFIGEGGLFPTPKEISFNCSCPDWALMCKHVSAVLYGVGVRFDEDPLLFFTLRGIEVEHFVDVTLENSVESMLRNVDVKSDRIITGNSWKKLFQ
ncbi:MAG TPA: hypothetical protein DCW47_08235 [Lachnospiraceae bacterium]|nr:hypothetical protein [Lachnospiraceae bacterium]